jgi:hypothetical protein
MKRMSKWGGLTIVNGGVQAKVRPGANPRPDMPVMKGGEHWHRTNVVHADGSIPQSRWHKLDEPTDPVDEPTDPGVPAINLDCLIAFTVGLVIGWYWRRG